jgi:hypothetical protein
VLQEDENARAVREVALVQGGIKKRSESRSALGLPTDAFDEVYYIPINIEERKPGEDIAARETSLMMHPALRTEPLDVLAKVLEGERDYSALGEDGA